MTPHELLRDVRRRALELLIDDSELDYITAERQAAREIAKRLKRKITAAKATRVQADRDADSKTQLLRKLEQMNRCLGSSCIQSVAGWTGGADVGQDRSYSQAERLALLPVSRRLEIIQPMPNAEVEGLLYDWKYWARPKQLAPPGDWSTCVLRAGRAFGKTRAGAGWVHDRAMAYSDRRIALVARTLADARDYMIEGPGGFLPNTHPRERPQYEPSKRRLTWPNGSWATIYSDEEPDQLRGFSGDTAWADEFAKFQNPEQTWINLEFGMREASNDRPRKFVTTTPRPITILKDIEKLQSTVVVTGASYENTSNLDPRWFEDAIAQYEGTRIGRQEILAEILDDVPNALWTRAMLDKARVYCDISTIKRAAPRHGGDFDSGEGSYVIGIA